MIRCFREANVSKIVSTPAGLDEVLDGVVARMAKEKRRDWRAKIQLARQKMHERMLFAETFCRLGGNVSDLARELRINRNTAMKRLKETEVVLAIERCRARTLAKAQEKTQVTADEMLASLARDLKFDPAKMYDEKGVMKSIHEIDEDTRLALRGLDTDQIRKRGKVIGVSVKAKFPEKTTAREQGMKHFGLYKEDNKQKGESLALTVVFGK